MLRKREDGIFPQKWRQVHEVAIHGYRLLSCERDVTLPRIQPKAAAEGPEASGALAVEIHLQSTLQADYVSQAAKVRLQQETVVGGRFLVDAEFGPGCESVAAQVVGVEQARGLQQRSSLFGRGTRGERQLIEVLVGGGPVA